MREIATCWILLLAGCDHDEPEPPSPCEQAIADYEAAAAAAPTACTADGDCQHYVALAYELPGEGEMGLPPPSCRSRAVAADPSRLVELVDRMRAQCGSERDGCTRDWVVYCDDGECRARSAHGY